MATITTEPIATNRYAPQGAQSINLYATDLASSLTLGQLTIAVSMRTAAAYEAQSVVKMNRMASGSEQLDKASLYMKGVADGTLASSWSAAKAYLENTLGITDSLPDAIDTYKKRMTAIAAIKAKVDALTQQQQEDMIDMQTLINRRDVAFSASSNIVRALGKSQNANADNL